MRDELYHSVKSGEVRYSDNGRFSYFWPKDLPFDIEFDKKMSKKMERTLISLSKLDGKVSQMKEEERRILLVPFILMESTKSSAIEGTGTTMEDLYLSEMVHEVDERKRNDNLEVRNYSEALGFAMKANDKRITEKLLFDIHSILMKGVRGEKKFPGKYRDVQVFLSEHGNRDFEMIEFIPMPPEQVPWKMINLIEYMNNRDENILVCAALSHYQFETIHPFTDGNGRMGRLLIMLILSFSNLLKYPVLYLSDYFNNRRDRYIDSLNRVREEDDFQSWIELFLDGLIEQSEKSSKMIDALSEYRAHLHQTTEPNMIPLVDSLFVNPFIRKADVAKICDVHLSTAGKMVDRLMERKVLVKTSDKRRNQIYVCSEIMRILNSY